MNFIANLSIRQIGAAVNLTAFANDSVSTEMSVWADNGILANHNVIVDIRRAWVFERNAIVHPLSIDSFLQRLLHLSELLSGIDTHHFTGVFHLYRGDLLSLLQSNRHGIGQVIFALFVMVFDFF